jgi:hypothetical protein
VEAFLDPQPKQTRVEGIIGEAEALILPNQLDKNTYVTKGT